MPMDEWLPCEAPLTDAQKSVLRRLRRMLSASRLPHLKRHRCSVALLDNGTVAVSIRHDRTPDVDVVVYALRDGRAEVWCDALGEMAHWDYERRDHDDAVEAVALLLHGWNRSVIIFEGGEVRHVLEEIVWPGDPASEDEVDDATLTKIHSRGRPLRIERRSVSWASAREPRVTPPAREIWEKPGG